MLRRILMVLLCFFGTACSFEASNKSNQSKSLAQDSLLRSAETLKSIRLLFNDHYKNRYVRGRCGKNIMEFVKALKENGADLSSFRVVMITNKGGSLFGMIKAEAARSVRWGKPYVWDNNWEHHVILWDQKENAIYDFDYQIEPTKEKLDTYIENMFLREPACLPNNDPYYASHGCIGRDVKLNDYMWETVPALDALAKKDQNKKKFRMKDLIPRSKL